MKKTLLWIIALVGWITILEAKDPVDHVDVFIGTSNSRWMMGPSVPYDVDVACRTLDYAYTDFCAAQLAQALGKINDHKIFIKRSEN